MIVLIVRADLVTAMLAGFGRTVSEVGAVILVGVGQHQRCSD
jgi:tungstate transport system permease protein